MKKEFLIVLTGLSLLLAACGRVEAGREDSDNPSAYQPVQTPTEAENAQKETVDAPIRGELRRVNSGARTFVIVLENGMEQTFRFNDFTQVSGDLSHVVVDPRTVGKKKISGPVQGLIGREGAYVTVEWSGGPHDKTATLVVVGDQN